MDIPPRVLLSKPKEKHLTAPQLEFLTQVRARLVKAGLELVGVDSVSRLQDQAVEMRMLQGAFVIAFSQWVGERSVRKRETVVMPTEFNHLTIALAAAARRPLIVLREGSVDERGGLRPALGTRLVRVPSGLDPSWLDTPAFIEHFNYWLRDVREQSHVFLAYCSKSVGTAAQIQIQLERRGARVVNWGLDFGAGGSILGEVNNALARCTAGVFLFTEDDPLEGIAGGAAPRDNVVFEAGYFMGVLGAHRCLIVRQGNAKMPADVGGTIYLQLQNGADVNSIGAQLAAFIDRTLAA